MFQKYSKHNILVQIKLVRLEIVNITKLPTKIKMEKGGRRGIIVGVSIFNISPEFEPTSISPLQLHCFLIFTSVG